MNNRIPTTTPSDLSQIFASRPGRFTIDRQSLSDIYFLLENGYLNLDKRFFCDKKKFLCTIERLYSGEIAIFDVDGGKIEHMALKAVARELFISKESLRIEKNFEGRIPDLMYEENGNIHIIECGNTDTTKIVDYFENKTVNEIIIVPFPDADDEALYMYSFTPGDELSDFLVFWKNEKIFQLKNNLKK